MFSYSDTLFFQGARTARKIAISPSVSQRGDRCWQCLTAEGSKGVDVSSQLSGHTQRLLGLEVCLTVQETNAGHDMVRKGRRAVGGATHSLTHPSSSAVSR